MALGCVFFRLNMISYFSFDFMVKYWHRRGLDRFCEIHIHAFPRTTAEQNKSEIWEYFIVIINVSFHLILIRTEMNLILILNWQIWPISLNLFDVGEEAYFCWFM